MGMAFLILLLFWKLLYSHCEKIFFCENNKN